MVSGDQVDRSGPGSPAGTRQLPEVAVQSHVSRALQENAVDVAADDDTFKASPMSGVVPPSASQALTIQFKPGVCCLNWQRQLQVEVKGVPAQTISLKVSPSTFRACTKGSLVEQPHGHTILAS